MVKDFNSKQLMEKINAEISKLQNLDEALKKGIRIIRKYTEVDYAIIWYFDDQKKEILHPYYWLGNKDFTSLERTVGQGIVGKACSLGTAINSYEYKTGEDAEMERDFEKEMISGMICVPFSNEQEVLGCIQVIQTNGESLSSQVSNLIENMIFMATMKMKETGMPVKEWKNRRKLMRIHDLEKSFPNGEEMLRVLKKINLDIYEGEFLVILGKSGCGKSTFLNIMGGLMSADDGAFYYQDQQLIGARKKELTRYRREHVGFIFQSYNLMPNLTVKQNIDFIAELVENPLDSEQLLERVGLIEKKDYYPSQLSGGQQQRVSIARALVKRQKLVLADEPTAALDFHTSVEILDMLSQIVKDGTTMIMVTHNEEITRMADRVVRMKDGKVYELSVNSQPVSARELEW